MITEERQITTHSPEESQALAHKIGKWLEASTVLALTGDLGSGKTTFVQGLASGLDVPDEFYVTSPSYTLINEYPGRYPLFHVDLYRLDDPADFEETGLYELLHGSGVVVIEWADRLHEDLLAEHLAIHLEILDDESRRITFEAHGLEAVNLIKKLRNSDSTN